MCVCVYVYVIFHKSLSLSYGFMLAVVDGCLVSIQEKFQYNTHVQITFKRILK